MREMFKSGSNWSVLGLISRLILGCVFIYASLDKIGNPDSFAEIIFNYKILPTELVNVVAIVLPWVELIAGVLLVTGFLPLPSTIILTGLTLLFIIVLAYNLSRGLNFQCGCFSLSSDARAAGLETLIRDIVLLVPAGICFFESIRIVRRKNEVGGPGLTR